MQRRKNMAQILLFAYVFIISISLFLVVTNGVKIPCVKDTDCPTLPCPLYSKCVDGFFLR
ncbi:putative Late nodulin [Medicago truncatula]|uniref:Putative Late nodulin n=1 Tax=Medicago truncatula TaxID=3880 RepID=A0A396I992_MEDTR|nr:putative Late nodulin [Medicago truncatula]